MLEDPNASVIRKLSLLGGQGAGFVDRNHGDMGRIRAQEERVT